MTKRLYREEQQLHGGRRIGAVLPQLTSSQVLQARELYDRGWSYKTLSATFGVSRYTLSRAIHGRRTYTAATSKPPVSRGVRNRNKA